MRIIDQEALKSNPILLREMRPSGFHRHNMDLCDTHTRNVTRGGGFEEVAECPLCASMERDPFDEKCGIPHFTCRECLCGYPGKVPKDLTDVYGGDEYVEEFSGVDAARENYKKERFGKERLAIIGDVLGGLSGKRILDVGCGTGWFLELCKENGMECYGQELGRELAAFTRARLGVEVFDVPIDEIPDRDGYFDVIVMFDLIEHLRRPVDFIRSLKVKLRQGGIILVFTPNFNSFGMQKLKRNSSLLFPTDHLCLFTEKTVARLAELVDMRVSWMSFNGIDMGDYLSFLEAEGHHLHEDVKQRLYDDLQPILDFFRYSNHFRFILTFNGNP
jgi:2-polyprenyl-3-methyl-5-hydroxy-6-metoxy-1,4-benzoquinol methylase